MIVGITGANGFIGGHLARRFGERGWEVRRIVRDDFERGQARELIRGADAVVHAAGATRATSVDRLRDSNVALTQQVANAVVSEGAGKLVLISSLAAVGPSPSLDRPVSETTPEWPIEAYGQSKLDAESVIRSSGTPFTILRPAAVYGPGDRDFFELFRLGRRGLAIHPANRDQWISIIYVHDLVDAVVKATETAEAVGRVYCLANERPVQWRALFSIAAGCAGKRLRLDVEVPRWVVDVGARVGDGIAMITGTAGLWSTRKVALSKPKSWVCSSALARRDLTLGPETPIERGFCETYRWYVEHEWF